MAADDRASSAADVLLEALRRQGDCDDHDRGLIAERLAWTPEQRFDATTSFLRFYFTIRPQGPLIGDV